MPAGFLAVS